MRWKGFFKFTKFKIIFLVLILLIFGIPYTYKICSNPFAWGDPSQDYIQETMIECQNNTHYYYVLRPIWAWDSFFVYDAILVWEFNLFYFLSVVFIFYICGVFFPRIFTIKTF